MSIVSAYRSSVGRVRKENQDSVGYFPACSLYVVADGMGGHAGGKEASETAIEVIYRRVTSTPTVPIALTDDDTTTQLARSVLIEAIQAANDRILALASEDSELEGMGTTVVAMLFEEDDFATIAHVGDSRAYRLRNDAFEQLTGDHSLVADLVRKGEISEEEAERHPYRHTLTRALGTTKEVDPDLTLLEVEPGDVYVLCSDGVYGMMSADLLAQIVRDNYDDVEAACDALVAAALEGGGKDNASVLILRALAD